MTGTVLRLDRLRTFVGEIGALVDRTGDERALLEEGRARLATLVRYDDWLPNAYAQPDAGRYQQYLLHCDSRERFSVVSFVWGPGQSTPVHNHKVWGLVGVLRGAELSERFAYNASGALRSAGTPERLEAGAVDAVSPSIGDIHQVANAYADRTSISIHLYGANIGAVDRATFDEAGQPRRFVSGYANDTLPNLWDRSGKAA